MLEVQQQPSEEYSEATIELPMQLSFEQQDDCLSSHLKTTTRQPRSGVAGGEVAAKGSSSYKYRQKRLLPILGSSMF